MKSGGYLGRAWSEPRQAVKAKAPTSSVTTNFFIRKSSEGEKLPCVALFGPAANRAAATVLVGNTGGQHQLSLATGACQAAHRIDHSDLKITQSAAETADP